MPPTRACGTRVRCEPCADRVHRLTGDGPSEAREPFLRQRVAVVDGAGRLAVRDPRAGGVGQAQGEGLVAFVLRVGVNGDLDGLRCLARRQIEGAGGGDVVLARRRGFGPTVA